MQVVPIVVGVALVFGGLTDVDASLRATGNANQELEPLPPFAGRKLPSMALDRIVSGRKALPGNYDFFAHMWWNGEGQGCGGALIASKWILTAAHCMTLAVANNYTELYYYPEWRIGSYCVSGNADGANCGVPLNVIKSAATHIHERYNPEYIIWDFALIELVDHSSLKPVRIDAGSGFDSLVLGQYVRAIGMGYVNDDKQFSEFLQEVDNHYLPLEHCYFFYNGGEFFDESVMCTDGTGRGQCAGDSGSPLLLPDPSNPSSFVQIGVTSFGPQVCEGHNFPDGGATLKAAYSWIVQMVCPTYSTTDPRRPEFCVGMGQPKVQQHSEKCANRKVDGETAATFLDPKKSKRRPCKKLNNEKRREAYCRNPASDAKENCLKQCGRC